jgi:hypothetical protein
VRDSGSLEKGATWLATIAAARTRLVTFQRENTPTLCQFFSSSPSRRFFLGLTFQAQFTDKNRHSTYSKLGNHRLSGHDQILSCSKVFEKGPSLAPLWPNDLSSHSWNVPPHRFIPQEFAPRAVLSTDRKAHQPAVDRWQMLDDSPHPLASFLQMIISVRIPQGRSSGNMISLIALLDD